MNQKCQCKLEDSTPFVYGGFNPPCILCGKCGKNMTVRMETLGVLKKGEYVKEALNSLIEQLKILPKCDHDSQKVGGWDCKACECITDTCGNCGLVLFDDLKSKACTNHQCDCHTGKLGTIYSST